MRHLAFGYNAGICNTCVGELDHLGLQVVFFGYDLLLVVARRGFALPGDYVIDVLALFERLDLDELGSVFIGVGHPAGHFGKFDIEIGIIDLFGRCVVHISLGLLHLYDVKIRVSMINRFYIRHIDRFPSLHLLNSIFHDYLCSPYMRRVKDIATVFVEAVSVREALGDAQFSHVFVFGDFVLVAHAFDLLEAVDHAVEVAVADFEEHFHLDFGQA